jgi:DNA-binding winged helix-turn-helix (wHTH) protein/TolB-like protein/Flp pilus assembly protein TadD
MQVYRFGEFELDLNVFELKQPGKPIKLERRALDLLALLVKQPNRVVPREEIIAALWPANVVIDFDSGLNTLVRKVRSALGDSPDNPRFIETVPGRGYRFVAPVETFAASSPPAAPSAEVPRRKSWPLIAAALALLVVIGAVVTWHRFRAPTGPTRIAVLPFENLTGNDELEYLAAGLAEDTSILLANIDVTNLRVIAVPAHGLTESARSIDEIGRRLSLDFVVQSSLQLEGNHIRVASRLVRVADNEQVWSQSIDRELTNAFGVQRELGTAIAEQVRMRLSAEYSAAIAKRQTQSPAAYALYLKARFEWNKLTPASTRRALEYFDEATKTDPDYALAWAGLAWAAVSSTRSADVAPSTAAPIAAKALAEAVRLGPDLVETKIAQGYFSFFHDLDAKGAQKFARASIAQDPNNALAHMLLGVSLMRENSVESREMMRRSRELEPMYALAFANSANVAIVSEDYARALEFSRQTIAIDPDFWLGHFYLGRAQLRLGEPEAALKEFVEAARLSDGHSLTYAQRVNVLVQLGRLDEARALLSEAEARATRQFMPPYAFATMHALLGNRDAAFQSLDRAIEARDVNLLGILNDPSLESLRDDPRYADVVRRCGCTPKPAAKP